MQDVATSRPVKPVTMARYAMTVRERFAFDIGRLRPYGTGEKTLVAEPDIGRRNEIRQFPYGSVRPNRQTISLQKTGPDQVQGVVLPQAAASDGV